MNQAAGETPGWEEGKRYALHHAIIAGDTAYGISKMRSPALQPLSCTSLTVSPTERV